MAADPEGIIPSRIARRYATFYEAFKLNFPPNRLFPLVATPQMRELPGGATGNVCIGVLIVKLSQKSVIGKVYQIGPC